MPSEALIVLWMDAWRWTGQDRTGRGGTSQGSEAALQGANPPTRCRYKFVQHVVVSPYDIAGARERLGTLPFGDRLRFAFLDPERSCDA